MSARFLTSLRQLKHRRRKQRAYARAHALRQRPRHYQSHAKNHPVLINHLIRAEVILPPDFDFVTHPVEVIRFVQSIRLAADERRCKYLLVNHAPLRRVTPDAALVLIAELYRAQRLHPSIEISIVPPENSAPNDLLESIGYFRYAESFTWENKGSDCRKFWKHRRGEGVRQTAAKDLIEYLPTMPREESTLLYEALVEGMQNASEWGYDDAEDGYMSWWLLGFWDPETGDVAFCFYDQGAGIPKTIRTRFWDTIPVVQRAGSILIRDAVVHGKYSRTKKSYRGRGLPTLYRFIDNADAGEMVIVSAASRCIFKPHATHVCNDYDCSLPGTLISWRLRRDAQ